MAYDVGDTIPLTWEIRDAGGSLTNANSMVVTIDLPDGSTVTPAVANPPIATGRYTLDYVNTVPGRHAVRAVSTGPSSAFADVFDVRPASPAYLISLADARKALRYGDGSTADDEELRIHIEAATWAVEDHVKQTIVRRTIVETARDCRYARRVRLDHTPVVSLTSVTQVGSSSTWNVADLDVDPDGIITVLYGARFWRDVRFVFVAGHTVIPANYLAATRIIVQHLWESQRGNAGAARVGGGGGVDDLALTRSGFALPKRALELLGGRPPLVG